MRTLAGMAVAACLAVCGGPVEASPRAGIEPLPLLQLAAADPDRLRVACRRKVRRHLGPVRGRHTGMLRIAYVEQCVANGGRLA